MKKTNDKTKVEKNKKSAKSAVATKDVKSTKTTTRATSTTKKSATTEKKGSVKYTPISVSKKTAQALEKKKSVSSNDTKIKVSATTKKEPTVKKEVVQKQASKTPKQVKASRGTKEVAVSTTKKGASTLKEIKSTSSSGVKKSTVSSKETKSTSTITKKSPATLKETKNQPVASVKKVSATSKEAKSEPVFKTRKSTTTLKEAKVDRESNAKKSTSTIKSAKGVTTQTTKKREETPKNLEPIKKTPSTRQPINVKTQKTRPTKKERPTSAKTRPRAKVGYRGIKPNSVEKGIVRIKDAKRARKINVLISLVLIVVLPIISVFLGSVIQRNNSSEALDWMGQNLGCVFLNSTFLLFMFFTFLATTNKLVISYILSQAIYLAAPIISRLKFDIRGEVLLLNDLALVKNANEMANFVEFDSRFIIQSIEVALIIIALSFLLHHKKIIVNRITSIVTALLLFVFLALTFVIPNSKDMILNYCGINTSVRFSPNAMHEKNGTWMGLYINHVLNKIEAPDNYSKDTVYKILNDANNKEQKITEIKPNVIMIMSESFYDPLNIPNVKFSIDPISNTRKLMEQYESGTMVSSTFAGGTSTIEFEAFTGQSVEFMPYGTVPYTDLEKQLSNVETIQKVFKNNGYKTLALHTYDGTFYNRENVYPRLGFDDFIEAKEMENVNYYGKYISDSTMNQSIISNLEKCEKNNEPVFIWALTMQNHTPYQTSNYTEGFDKVHINSDNLSNIAKDKLMAYINGLYESDIQIKNLIDYLNKKKTPTVLMFFGDHLPALYEVYYETGMISTKETSKWTKEEMYKMHQTPYFIYDNFSKTEKEHKKITGAVLMGNELLNYIGIPKSSYFNYLDTLNYRALRDRLFVNKQGKIYDSISEECIKKANEHKLLEYDMIYGNNYVKEHEIHSK